jgi:hypothetical protein
MQRAEPHRQPERAGGPSSSSGTTSRVFGPRLTCLTLLLEQHTPPHVVQEIAGHAALYATSDRVGKTSATP